MKIDDLIKKLDEIRRAQGNLSVVVHDGGDPSDLCQIRRVETGIFTFFTSDFGRADEQAVRLL